MEKNRVEGREKKGSVWIWVAIGVLVILVLFFVFLGLDKNGEAGKESGKQPQIQTGEQGTRGAENVAGGSTGDIESFEVEDNPDVEVEDFTSLETSDEEINEN